MKGSNIPAILDGLVWRQPGLAGGVDGYLEKVRGKIILLEN